ncbi:hypothetical protein E2320_013907 [Naja naja]|nr:hypothetical protein E2320_013907 [Naja naja]
MDSFLKRNREENGHRTNITFDLIFSNWLFMYLSDAELKALVQQMLLWLKPHGRIFFRESCFYQSGNSHRSFNPSFYRKPAEYNQLLTSAQVTIGNTPYGFEIVLSRSVQAYIKRKQNQNQICWLLQKGPRELKSTLGYDTFQKFLDNEQYATRSIRRYEWVFGPTFVSTGGLESTKVQFEISDVTRRIFPEASFDIVYSRDTILHIEDKISLFRRFLLLQEAGFVQVQALDSTNQMLSSLTQELQALESSKETFVQEFSEEEFESMASSWRAKLQRCAAGDQRWGVFLARKPECAGQCGHAKRKPKEEDRERNPPMSRGNVCILLHLAKQTHFCSPRWAERLATQPQSFPVVMTYKDSDRGKGIPVDPSGS